MAELKPCRCGCEGKDLTIVKGRGYFISCAGCGKFSRIYDTKEQAIDAWNKRS